MSKGKRKSDKEYIGGTSSVSIQNEGEEKEQATRATIGQGNITIGGVEQRADSELLAGLNRDIGLSQEVTRDELTGGLDYSVTIDHEIVALVGKLAVKGTAKVAKAVAEQGVNLTEGLINAIAGALSGLKGGSQGEGDNSGQDGSAEDPEGAGSQNGSKYSRTMTQVDADGNTITVSVTVSYDENGEAVVSYAQGIEYGEPQLVGDGLHGAPPVLACGGGDFGCASVPIDNGNIVAGEMPVNKFSSEEYQAGLNEQMRDIFNQVMGDVNEFLAKNWDNSDVKTGLLGVQEGMWSSVAGQTLAGTFGEIGGYVTPVFDLAGYGWMQMGEAAGLVNPGTSGDFYYAPYSAGMDLLGSAYGSLPYERQQDLGLIGDAGLIWGGTKLAASGISGVISGGSSPKLLGTQTGVLGAPGNYPLVNYYPPNNGFWGSPTNEFLMPGAKISRYGSNNGYFLSPSSTPLPNRSLPSNANISLYNNYEVIRPFPVQSGTIAPAFGQPGFGTQYISPVRVQTLLDKGIIKKVN